MGERGERIGDRTGERILRWDKTPDFELEIRESTASARSGFFFAKSVTKLRRLEAEAEKLSIFLEMSLLLADLLIALLIQ